MKKIFRTLTGISYLIALFFSLLLLLKAGASIFFKKIPIDSQSITRQEEASSIQVPVNTHIYDPDSIVLWENGTILEQVSKQFILSTQKGVYSVAENTGQGLTLLFTPLEPDQTNSHYSVYIRPYLLSYNSAGTYSLILLLGLIAFLSCSLSNPEKRKILLGSPFGLVQVWLGLFETQEKSIIPSSQEVTSWRQAGVNVVLATYSYIAIEWIFFVTKPSFMDAYPLGEKIKIFPLTALITIIPVLLVLIVLYVVNFLLGPRLPWFTKYSRHIPTAFVLACLALIWLDNFTYTVFQFGVVDSKTVVRLLYSLLFVLFFYYTLRKLAAAKYTLSTNLLAVTLVCLSLVLAGIDFHPLNIDQTLSTLSSGKVSRPNIIFIGTDGLSAESMSVYGYKRNTTPFLSQLAQTSLVSLNTFPNSGQSMGSDTALLTGKLPFDTGVFQVPDTLQGSDKYQHLPGLLKNEGYRTVQLGVEYYVDANTIDFQNAFDAVSCRENNNGTMLQGLERYGYDKEVYFINQVSDRITNRLTHILFMKDMVNPFALVTQSDLPYSTDQDRMACLETYLDEVKDSGQPLFAHIHLMGTHGEEFSPQIRLFSAGEEQTDGWMTDFYDDAILDFDQMVNQLVQVLQENGQYDNTILVIYSDHAEMWQTNVQIPLILHFPGDQNAGKITTNAQLVDVAPTILDYLGLQSPEWMVGSSLLGEIDPLRMIISGKRNKTDDISASDFTVESNSSSERFNDVTVIQCQNWYNYDLLNKVVTSGEVSNYVDPCPADQLAPAETVKKQIDELLRGYGYNLLDNW